MTRALPLGGCAIALAVAGLTACGGRPEPPGAGGPVRTIAAPAADVGVARRVGVSPSAVAVGFGAVWVASRDAGTVTRVDARTGVPALSAAFPEPLVTGGGPLAIAAGEGAVWVAAADGTVTRIDPARGSAREVARVVDPGGIAAGAGAVWVTSRERGTVSRLDPRTGAPTGEPIEVGSRPGDVAVGGGSVWVANTADGTVSRVDPGERRVAGGPTRVGREQVLALSYGDGGVWVAKTDSPQADPIALVRIDPRDGDVDPEAIRVTGGVPLDLAVGGGFVWVTDAGSALPGDRRPAALLRVDPAARALAGRPVEVGASPAGVAVGAGAVWVVTAGDGALQRVALRSR